MQLRRCGVCRGLALLACATGSLGFLANCQGASAGAVTWDMPATRREALLRELTTKNGLHQRAIQELQPGINQDPRVLKTMLQSFLSEGCLPTAETWALVALGSANGEGAKVIVRAYREGDAKTRRRLRAVLGRMGAEAREAVPDLREEIQEAQATQADRIEILIVLAAIGDASASELGEIAQGIAAHDERCVTAAGVMSVLGRNEWATETIRSALIRVVSEDSSPGGWDVAWALGTLGKHTDAAVRSALEHRFATDLKKARSRDYVFSGLALALASPERMQEVLGAVLRRQVAEYGVDVEHAVALAWPFTGDVRLVDAVASFLSHSDSRVSKEAANILGVMGLAARSAKPVLIWQVELGKDQGARQAAARALGRVAIVGDLPELRRLRTLCNDNTELHKWIDVSIAEVEAR